MARKKFTIWLDEAAAERFRKRAIAEGRTLSETGAGLMESALEGREESRGTLPASSPSIDPSALKKMVESGLEDIKNEVKKVIREIPIDTTIARSSCDNILSKETIFWNIDMTARIYALLLFLSMKSDPGGHPSRVQSAKNEGERIAKNLGYNFQKEA